MGGTGRAVAEVQIADEGWACLSLGLQQRVSGEDELLVGQPLGFNKLREPGWKLGSVAGALP